MLPRGRVAQGESATLTLAFALRSLTHGIRRASRNRGFFFAHGRHSGHYARYGRLFEGTNRDTFEHPKCGALTTRRPAELSTSFFISCQTAPDREESLNHAIQSGAACRCHICLDIGRASCREQIFDGLLRIRLWLRVYQTAHWDRIPIRIVKCANY